MGGGRAVQAAPHSLSGCHPSFRAAAGFPLSRAAAITHMLAHALPRQRRTHGRPHNYMGREGSARNSGYL